MRPGFGSLLVACGSATGEPAISVQLPSTEFESVELFDSQAAKLHVICFLGTECPLARLYGPRLSEMAAELSPQEVRFLGVNSNRQDSMQDVRDYVESYSIKFDVVKDYDGAAAKQLGATRTPEVFVLDNTGETRYRGRIDDQYSPGIARTKATKHELKDAITALLAGREVEHPQTEAAGCIIGHERKLAESGDVTYCDQIARLLKRHCIECHSAGEIGPFSLTDYDEVVGWGEMMLEVIDDHRMPPWHANPKYGSFVGSRTMPDDDKELLRRWVNGGMPYGDPNRLPEPPVTRGEWALGEPDAVLVMSKLPYKVPAEGTVEYQYFVVDSGFGEDRWIQSAEVIPGNRSVVHHAIIFIRPPDGTSTKGISWLTAYVPGQRNASFPDGLARRVPAGSKFVFQMHYTPTGSEAEDLTRVGIKFAEAGSVTHEVSTVVAIDQDFEIPPGASEHPVPIRPRGLPDHGQLLGVAPHMHLRGRSFRLFGKLNESDEEILLDVPSYDFNWQHFYAFEDPVDLAEVEHLHATVHFDNSESNPFNPDPTEHVSWGDQTWEEMAIAFFEVATPLAKPEGDKKRKANRPRESKRNQTTVDAEKDVRVKEFVANFFKQMDIDSSGSVSRDETPISFQRYSFNQFDHDGDGSLSKQEVETRAKQRL